MERYRCDPQVLKACKIRKLYGCDGYYLGAGCRCAKDNQSIMAETEYQELQAYRATGLTVERAAELGKADREGRVLVLRCQEGSNIYVIYPHVNAESEIEKRYFSLIYFSLNDFGKRWFLTREEAEKALEAEQDG